MNGWLWAAAGFALCLALCLPPLLRGTLPDRVAAAQLASTAATLALVCLAYGMGHDYLLDVALAQALAGLVGGLVFAHALERWL